MVHEQSRRDHFHHGRFISQTAIGNIEGSECKKTIDPRNREQDRADVRDGSRRKDGFHKGRNYQIKEIQSAELQMIIEKMDKLIDKD